ncbi:MAG: hypothetical protein WAW78_10710 [Propioniciclava sp.]
MTIDQHTTPDPEPPAAPRRDLTVEGGASAPEAVQAADVDRGSRDTKELEVERPARGVDWVRPSDLLSRASGALARSGIDFQAGLAQRARSGIVAGAKASASRVRRLAPLSAFGRGEPAVEQRGLERT